jgi:hypothetical protein
MMKKRTDNSRTPKRRGFTPSRHFEDLAEIMRANPLRFRRFSAGVKYQLSIYLWMKGQGA